MHQPSPAVASCDNEVLNQTASTVSALPISAIPSKDPGSRHPPPPAAASCDKEVLSHSLHSQCSPSSHYPIESPMAGTDQPPSSVAALCNKEIPNHTASTVSAHLTSTTSSTDPGSSLTCDWLIFSACLLNYRSLMHKLCSFPSFVHSSPFKVIGVVETSLTPSIFDNEILSSQFTIFHRDRPTRGGGVLLAAHKSISSRLVSSPPNLEVISVDCVLKFSVILCIVYTTL